MKRRVKNWLLILAVLFTVFVGLGGTWFWYLDHYVHQHCIKVAGMAFEIYSSEHQGQLPFSTNGFGDALLILAKSDPSVINTLCGPDDDGHVFREALTNNLVVSEAQCSRVYIQGLSESNNPDICILFDRNSCKGGDHFRSPWGHPLREACLLDGSMVIIRDKDWPEFSRKQVALLIAAGFAQTNALRLYPAAN
jgi:hypothetical protein